MNIKDKIPAEKMHEIATDLIDMKVKAVTFSGGGEPLLYKPLPKTIEQLSAGNIRIGCLSNGANLKGHMANVIASHVSWLRISLDGWDDNSFAKNRGIRIGEFTKLLDNIDNFQHQNSSCTLGVSLIVSAENANKILDICKLMKQLRIDHVKISGAIISNDIGENNQYHAKIHDIVTDQIKQVQKLHCENFTTLDHYHSLPTRFNKEYSTCPYLMFLTVIGADQMVYTCQDKAYASSGALGSIEKKSFKEMWMSEETKQRIFSFNPKISCRHHCVTNPKNEAIHSYLKLDREHINFV